MTDFPPRLLSRPRVAALAAIAVFVLLAALLSALTIDGAADRETRLVARQAAAAAAEADAERAEAEAEARIAVAEEAAAEAAAAAAAAEKAAAERAAAEKAAAENAAAEQAAAEKAAADKAAEKAAAEKAAGKRAAADEAGLRIAKPRNFEWYPVGRAQCAEVTDQAVTRIQPLMTGGYLVDFAVALGVEGMQSALIAMVVYDPFGGDEWATMYVDANGRVHDYGHFPIGLITAKLPGYSLPADPGDARALAMAECLNSIYESRD